MKRFVTILLALAMLASMGSTVYAADTGSGSKDFTAAGESESVNVYGTFQQASNPDSVYSVTVEWDSLEFTCMVNGVLKWNPSDHSYTNNRTFTWKPPADLNSLLNPRITDPQKNRTVRVTNNSNADVYVKAEAGEASYGFDLSVVPNTVLQVSDPADTTTVVKNYEDFTVQIISPTTPDEQIQKTQAYQIGTVTITVSATNIESP